MSGVPVTFGRVGCGDDRRAGGGAGGHVHDRRSVSPFVEQVDSREVEIELWHGRIGQVAGDRVEHVLLA